MGVWEYGSEGEMCVRLYVCKWVSFEAWEMPRSHLPLTTHYLHTYIPPHLQAHFPLLDQLRQRADPGGAEGVALGGGDFFEVLGEVDAVELVGGAAGPGPLAAKLVGFEPIIALFPGLAGHVNRGINLVQGQGDKGDEVACLVVNLALVGQGSQGQGDGLHQPVTLLANTIRINQSAQRCLLRKQVMPS